MKNKTISVLDVLISAKSEEYADVYFGRKVVIEYISNKEIKLWEYADYLKSNGDNDGVLGVYSGDVLSNDIGSKPNVGKIKNKKQYLYREENNHNVNNIFQQNAEVPPYASITSNDITVTVQGYIYYKDSNGNTKPLPYSEVEVWEDDGNSAYSAFEWSDLTSSTGYFNVTVTHNDNDTNLELFLRVKSLNSWISVENYTNWIPGNGLAVYGDQPFQWTGNTVNNITGGTVSMNYIIDDTRKGAAQLFDWLMTTTIFTRNSFDPGAVQAVWPAGSYAYSDPAYNNNLVIGDLHTNSNYPDVVFHEFGHTTMYRRNSYSAPNSIGQHSLSGLYSPGLAWSEGWATAYSQFILNDGRYDAANFAPLRPHVENAKLGYGDNATYYPPNAQDNSSHNEVWVAAALLDFYDYGEPDNGDDPANRIISFNELLNIIANNNINSFIDFYNLMINGSLLTQIEKNYASRVAIYNKFTVDLIPGQIIFTASISGPNYLNSYQNGTWTCSVSGGTAQYHYQWYYLYPASDPIKVVDKPTKGYWFKLGTDSPTLTRSDNETFHLKCEVTDATNTLITSNTKIVSVGGSLAKRDVNNSSINILRSTKLYSNYPNPFNPTTIIKYDLQETGLVSIKVYDMLGKEVATLVNGVKEAGSFSINFNASNLASGLYIYRMQTNKHMETKKMFLVK